jgi:hypothetical protein
MFSCIVSSIVTAAAGAVVAALSDEESPPPHPATARPATARPITPRTRAERMVPSFFILFLLVYCLYRVDVDSIQT